MKKLFVLLFVMLLATKLASAMVANSVNIEPISPGQESRIDIEIKNIFSDDAKDVSLSLDFTGLPLIPVGASEQSVDKIKEDDEEDFTFGIRASTDVTPGDYEIPYTLSYTMNSDERTRTGTIGVKIKANPELEFSATAQTPVINTQGKMALKIVNRGLLDARFVSVKIIPDGFTLLSDDEDYIGTIDSDDFETASFDVIFTSTRPNLVAIVNYRDFDNEQITKSVNLPVEVYTHEKAIQLGLIQQSKTTTYIISAVVIIIVFLLWRWWRKRRKSRKNQRRE